MKKPLLDYWARVCLRDYPGSLTAKLARLTLANARLRREITHTIRRNRL